MIQLHDHVRLVIGQHLIPMPSGKCLGGALKLQYGLRLMLMCLVSRRLMLTGKSLRLMLTLSHLMLSYQPSKHPCIKSRQKTTAIPKHNLGESCPSGADVILGCFDCNPDAFRMAL